MLRYILRRVLLMIPVLLGVSLVTFIIIRSIPGDPVQVLLGADRRTTPEQIAALIDAHASRERPLFYVGSSGVEMAVGSHLARPVVVPNSPPRVRMCSPTSSSSSVGNGPEPTRVV